MTHDTALHFAKDARKEARRGECADARDSYRAAQHARPQSPRARAVIRQAARALAMHCPVR